MFAFNKLSTEVKSFVLQVTNEGSSRKIEFSLALARLLSNRLNMPTSSVLDVENYYCTTLLIGVLECINDINEIFVIDIDQVKKLTQALFMYRYNTLYPLPMVVISRDFSVEDFFGIRKFINEGILTVIKENSVSVMYLNNNLSKLLDDISA